MRQGVGSMHGLRSVWLQKRRRPRVRSRAPRWGPSWARPPGRSLALRSGILGPARLLGPEVASSWGVRAACRRVPPPGRCCNPDMTWRISSVCTPKGIKYPVWPLPECPVLPCLHRPQGSRLHRPQGLSSGRDRDPAAQRSTTDSVWERSRGQPALQQECGAGCL